MNGFDPLIALKSHVTLLKVFDEAKEFVMDSRGLNMAIGKLVGQVVVAELEKSRQSMRANKMWVDENPVRERRYRYSLFGRREEYEISAADLNFYLGIVLQVIEKKMDGIPRR